MKIHPIYALLIFAALAVSVYFNVKQLDEKVSSDKRVELLEQTSAKQSILVERYVAPDSTQHVRTSEVYASSDLEKELAVSPGYVDSLKKALDIKTRQLDEVTRVKATVTGTGKIERRDSLGKSSYSFSNGFLSFTHNDSLAKYQYDIGFNSVKYHKGNWLTGKRYFKDLSFTDPNARINGLRHFTVPEPKAKRVGIGFQAGYYFDPVEGRLFPAAGFGISYNLIRF